MKCQRCGKETEPIFCWINAPSLDNPSRRLKMYLCQECIQELLKKGIELESKDGFLFKDGSFKQKLFTLKGGIE